MDDQARKAVISRDETTLIGGVGNKADIAARCRQIRLQIEETTSSYDREKLQERLAKLTGGIAIVHVGGATETEVKERKDRVDDAVNATKAAVEEGILPGGGVALLRAAAALKKLEPTNADRKFGIEIVRKALQSPIRQIISNSGSEASVVVGKLLQRDDANGAMMPKTASMSICLMSGSSIPPKLCV